MWAILKIMKWERSLYKYRQSLPSLRLLFLCSAIKQPDFRSPGAGRVVHQMCQYSLAPGVITAPSRESGILDGSKGGENTNPERKHLPLQKLETQEIAAKERNLIITVWLCVCMCISWRKLGEGGGCLGIARRKMLKTFVWVLSKNSASVLYSSSMVFSAIQAVLQSNHFYYMAFFVQYITYNSH